MHRLYNVLDTWRERASNVSGQAGSTGNFIPRKYQTFSCRAQELLELTNAGACARLFPGFHYIQ